MTKGSKMMSLVWAALLGVGCFFGENASQPSAEEAAYAAASRAQPRAKSGKEPRAESDPSRANDNPADTADAPAVLTATLVSLRGKVTVNGKAATVGQRLVMGDVVRTRGKSSRVEVHLSDGSRIRLDAKSKLTLSELEKSVSFKLWLGKLYSYVASGTDYEVETVNAVAGVRGTKFVIEEGKKGTYVCVCEGTVAITAEKNSNDVLLEEGLDTWIRNKKARAPSDSRLQMLDALNATFEEMLQNDAAVDP